MSVVPQLVRVATSSSHDAVLVEACTCMANLSFSLEIRESLGKCGSVPPLMWLIRNSTTPPVLAAAAAAIGNLGYHHDLNRCAIVDAGTTATPSIKTINP